MDPLPVNAVYRADCLSLLERMQSEHVTLAYVDAPWSTGPAQKWGLPVPAERGNLQGYLEFLSRVLQQIERVLARSGSLYFHSEPSVTGHTRLILDQVLGRENFRMDIIWPRRRVPGTVGPSTKHDTIFLYTKSDSFTYNREFRPLSEDEVRSRYPHSDEGRRYVMVDLTSSIARPNLHFEWKGTVPPPGLSWRYSEEELDRLDWEGRIHHPLSGGLPRQKLYLDEQPGVEVGSLWDDIARLSPLSRENLRYPGQRPLALLERILRVGSNEGDIILDPFCGTGTALVAAQANGRRWLGCDLSPEACSITTTRLEETIGLQRGKNFFVGEQDYIEHFPVIQSAYFSVATGLEQASPERFFLNQPLHIEETRHYEFKEVRGPNPVNSIKNVADEYVVAFLNSEGGRIFWGIRDKDRVVIGVHLDYAQRDEVKRIVLEKLFNIQPAVAPTAYRLEFHPVHDRDVIPDLYVVEIVVPRVSTTNLYFTGGNEAFVKTDAGKRKLTGPEIQEEVLRRGRI
jgi:DNA modification methylase